MSSGIGPIFAWTIITLSACASIGYAVSGDARHAIYWAAGTALNLTMTWR